MQIVEQSHKMLKCGTIQSVELAGRTAYKSEDRITPVSAERFIKSIIERGHESVLEHYPLVFRVRNDRPTQILGDIREILGQTVGLHYTVTSTYFVLSMNARTLRDAVRRVNNGLSHRLLRKAMIHAPVLFMDLGIPGVHDSCVRSVSEWTLVRSLPPSEAAKHIYRMVRFITDRGVTHEIVRQRLCAYTQESTRYCNYAKRGIKFVKPVFWTKDDPEYQVWLMAMEQAEKYYNILMNDSYHRTPQEARTILPNSLKTEIVCTTNITEWHHIMKLRTAKNAHPQMQALMIPLLKDFQRRMPAMFSDVGVPL